MDSPQARNPSANLLSDELLTAVIRGLERGGAVVTGNARAARWLRAKHAESQRATGRSAWPTPPIHDWASWLETLWKQHLSQTAEAPLLLTPVQERVIWKRIVAVPVAESDAVAEMAAQAWALLSDYQSHSERSRTWPSASTGDGETFRGWAARFERECRTHGWLSRAGLAALLNESICKGELHIPSEIFMVGFDRLTPAQKALLDAARNAGCGITLFEEPRPSESPLLVQASDQIDELATCAWWARRILESDPNASLAVIVQGIDKKRGEIERTFRRILMPESTGIENDEPMPFEFSLGTPLATVPLVKAALLLLRWIAEPLDQNAVSWLTTSGFLASDGDDELLEMAAFDAEIRKHGHLPPLAPLDIFAHYPQRIHSETVRHFLGRLRRLLRAVQAEIIGNRKKTFSEWSDFAEGILKGARWPGDRTLESDEYQARSRWQDLLGEVAALGFDGSRANWNEFVTILDRCAAKTIFAPESRNAPIQIMGALESAGQRFDALWFLSADERQWPPAGEPNPLLPLWLQRNAAMPHASIDADWRLNLAITRRIAASASESVFSHALRDDAGELRPSGLITEAFGGEAAIVSAQGLRSSLQVPVESTSRRLTEWIDDTFPILWPQELHAGGAEILKRQSACAFQSFAVRRLGAEELEEAERGLSPRDRGSILHAVMEAFWSNSNPDGMLLRDRDDLFNASVTGRLPDILRHHIAEVFRRRRNRDGDEWSNAYLQAEQDRLHAVLARWLEYEIRRQPFTVEDQEKKVLTQINGLQLSLRVDRIDLVEGGRLILDYKTGGVTASMWDGERPEEPQLPLYGIYGGIDDLRGVLFAQIRAGEAYFVGRAEGAAARVIKESSLNLKRNELTQAVRDQWALALSKLANDFLNGRAAVAPKSYPQTCRYCSLAALCRVSETSVVLEGDEEEEVEDFGDTFANG